MENKILKTVRDNCLINPGDSVLVALSGGADSVALLYAMHNMAEKLGITVYAAHVHHGIRGEEADRDAEFSAELCRRTGIRFFTERFDVPAYAAENHISEETAGRVLRYGFFEKILKENNITSVATAHHLNDRAETVLMNIIRGSGLKGMTGIEYRNGNVIRPLLDLTREETEEYCHECGAEYCNDSTNSETVYRRNKIRIDIMPKLRELNPDFDNSIIRSGKIMSADDDLLEKLADEEYAKAVCGKGIDCGYFKTLHVSMKRRVARRFIAEKKGSILDISFEDAENLSALCDKSKTGAEIYISGGLRFMCLYGYVDAVSQSDTAGFRYEMEIDVPCFVKETGTIYTIVKAGSGRNKLVLDKNDKIILRTRCDGDVLYPVGMAGKKKVKDLLIDKKISKTERDRVPILTVNGEIASVVGIRDDRRFNNSDGEYILRREKVREGSN